MSTATAGERVGKLPPPPIAPVEAVTDEYFGTKLVDPYRWMEAMDARTLDWMKAQGRYTRAVFESIPARGAYLKRLSAFTSSFGAVKSYQSYGGRILYLYRSPGADGFDLVVRDSNAAVRKIVDVAALSAAHQGIPHAIDYFQVSPDGRKVGVGVSPGGSEDAAFTVYDVSTGVAVGGPISRAQFAGLSWSDDSRTLFFNRLAEKKPDTDRYLNSVAAVWTMQGEPVPLFGANLGHGPSIEPQQFPYVRLWPGATRAALIVVNGVQQEKEIWVTRKEDAAEAAAHWRRVATFADEVTAAEMIGDSLFLLSHRNAPTFRVLRLDGDQVLSRAQVLLDARPDRVLESIRAAADGLYVVSRAGVYSHLIRIPVNGKVPEEIALPFQGDISEVFADAGQPGVTVTLESWVQPPTQLRFEPRTRKITALELDPRPRFDPAEFNVTSLEAIAGDGVHVPLTLVRPAGSRRAQPTLLFAYGSYGLSTLPQFRSFYVPFMEQGAATAFCHVRGGGELGEAWHLGGKDALKPNTWRDLIACGEELIERGVTTRELLFIRGGSAGGITVGRAMEERPDLFAGVIAQVPGVNPVRYETAAGGAANVPEFGSVNNPQGFRNLLAMDAYHGVRDGVQYPPIMITTGLNDSRVASWIPAKFAARLQASGTRAPVLLRVDEQAGHGIGAARYQLDELFADVAAFVFWHAEVQGWQPSVLQ